MSTLATATLASDSEDDGDFVPTSPKKRSRPNKGMRKRKHTQGLQGSEEEHTGSSSSGTDSESDVGETSEEAKRLKLDQEAVEADERRRKAAEAFRAMQEESAGLARASTSKADVVEGPKAVEMVQITRPRQFAGETIYETVSLASTDPEAIAFLNKRPISQAESEFKELGNGAEALNNSTPNGAGISNSIPTSATPANALPAAPATAPVATKPIPNKGPLKRKPRQSLEAMSAALDKGKKMTTLEKSQMDWKSHTSSDQLMADELARNRKGGGYIEKQQFLDRVGERREGTYERHGTVRR